MNDTEFDDFIERLLRNDARSRQPDDGFAARVMLAIPASRSARWRPALILGSTAIGGVLASALGPVGPTLARGFADLTTLQAFTPSATYALAAAIAIAVVGAVLVQDAD
jgi:hypothetical protein